MTARRFKLVFDDGSTFHCVAFETEQFLDQALAQAATGASPQETETVAAIPRDAEPRLGRPSYEAAIEGAASAIAGQLDANQTLAERTRLVLKQLAATTTDLPDRRTVERWLVRQKSRQNSRQKSDRARIHRQRRKATC